MFVGGGREGGEENVHSRVDEEENVHSPVRGWPMGRVALLAEEIIITGEPPRGPSA